MAIFLALSLACARHHSNGFKPINILKVNKSDLIEAPLIPKRHPQSFQDLREKSKPSNGISAHEVVLLNIPTNLLSNKANSSQHQLPSQSLRSPCKAVQVRGKPIFISQPLSLTIEIMGEFSLTCKDVGNRLAEAYKAIGLSQSSGGISPRCFRFDPHPWPGCDLRKTYKVEVV